MKHSRKAGENGTKNKRKVQNAEKCVKCVNRISHKQNSDSTRNFYKIGNETQELTLREKS